MIRASLSRRTVLRGAGGIAVALPFLEAMMPRRAAAAGRPKRLILFWESNGYVRSAWTPSGTDANFVFSPILKPLEAFRSDLLIVSGLNIRTSGPGSPHMRGIGGVFTGSGLQGPSAATGNLSAGFANGPSVDQYVASKLGGATKLRSLELGVSVDSKATAETRMIFDLNKQAMPPQNSPSAVFGRLFSGTTLPAPPPASKPGEVTPPPPVAPAVDPRVLQRRSILDFLKDDYDGLNKRLGGEDKRRLSNHLEALRELERQISVGTPGAPPTPGVGAVTPTLSCAKPEVTQAGSETCSAQGRCSDANVATVGKQQMDLLVMALACDLTRVASLQWSNCGNRIIYRSLGLTETHHDLGHAAATEPLTKINTWYAQQFAYLIGKLKQVKEADGSSLLDNCLVLWGNELSSGAAHNHGPMPFVIAGKAGGALRTGRHVAASGAHNALLVSCLNAMGLPDTSFGTLSPNSGPLPGLT